MSLVSEEAGFIYVRVPRTGSTTHCAVLNRLFGDDLQRVSEQHASAVQLRGLLGAKWSEYFTYGFIRNPWDWLVSFYNAGISNSPFGKEPWPGKALGPLNTERPVERTNASFEEFVRQRRATPLDWLSDGASIIVDRVYRFEDFVQDEQTHLSGMRHAPYRAWYTDALAAYVADKCAQEIALGGYEF